MNKIARTTALLATLALAAGAATAQQVGNYAGTTSQGLRFEFTVSDDGIGGFVLTDVSLDLSATCSVSGRVLDSGLGVGSYVPFTGNLVQTVFAFNTLYEPVSIRFRPNGTAVGNVSVSYPAYVDVNVNRKTENCATGKLTFTAAPVVEAMAARPARPAGGVTMVPLN